MKKLHKYLLIGMTIPLISLSWVSAYVYKQIVIPHKNEQYKSILFEENNFRKYIPWVRNTWLTSHTSLLLKNCADYTDPYKQLGKFDYTIHNIFKLSLQSLTKEEKVSYSALYPEMILYEKLTNDSKFNSILPPEIDLILKNQKSFSSSENKSKLEQLIRRVYLTKCFLHVANGLTNFPIAKKNYSIKYIEDKKEDINTPLYFIDKIIKRNRSNNYETTTYLFKNIDYIQSTIDAVLFYHQEKEINPESFEYLQKINNQFYSQWEFIKKYYQLIDKEKIKKKIHLNRKLDTFLEDRILDPNSLYDDSIEVEEIEFE